MCDCFLVSQTATVRGKSQFALQNHLSHRSKGVTSEAVGVQGGWQLHWCFTLRKLIILSAICSEIPTSYSSHQSTILHIFWVLLHYVILLMDFKSISELMLSCQRSHGMCCISIVSWHVTYASQTPNVREERGSGCFSHYQGWAGLSEGVWSLTQWLGVWNARKKGWDKRRTWL